MKYVVLIIVSAFGGFLGAWLLFRVATSSPVDIIQPGPPNTNSRAVISTRPLPRTNAPRPTRFSDIEQSTNVFDQQYLAWRLAAQSDVPALQSLIRQCLNKSDPLYSEDLVAIFLERYTELDPAGAMRFVTREHRLDQATFQGNVLTSWVRYDPQAAVDYFSRINHQDIRINVGMRLLADPAVAQAGLVDRVKAALGPSADRIMQQSKWRRADPMELFKQSLVMTGSDRRTQMINAVSRWASRDPVAALAGIATLSNPNERQMMTQTAIQQYAQQDPRATLAWLQTNQPRDIGMQRQVLNIFAAQNVNEALPLVEDFVRRTGQTTALDGIIDIWARRDPQKAIDYISRLAEPDKSRLYMTLAQSYLRSHPVTGLNWVVSLGPEYASIKRTVLHQVNGENARAAEAALGNSSDATTRSALIRGIAQYKGATDPRAALNWLGDYQGDKAYLPAYESVLSRYAPQHPEQASRLLDTSLTGSRVSAIASNILSAWYQKDPQGATGWATSLPRSDAQTGAMSRLVVEVSRKDPDEALALSRALPANVQRRLPNSIAVTWVSLHPEQIEAIITKLNPSPGVVDQLRRLADRRRQY